MLTLAVNINGRSLGDLEAALTLITQQITNGFDSGFDRNANGNYRYMLCGDEERPDDEDEEDETEGHDEDCESLHCDGGICTCGLGRR